MDWAPLPLAWFGSGRRLDCKCSMLARSRSWPCSAVFAARSAHQSRVVLLGGIQSWSGVVKTVTSEMGYGGAQRREVKWVMTLLKPSEIA